MGVMDYFKPVETWSAEKVREFINAGNEGEYNLVDVRQPAEYEQGHLPGARLIPLGELPERASELDPARTTIVYCGAGVRSRAAASILDREGFREVISMSGGIVAWQGLVAEGFPEAGIPWFSAARSLAELTALAWVLEESTGMFYAKMAETVSDGKVRELFLDLASAEQRHEGIISALYRELTGAEEDFDFPAMPGKYPQKRIMEGGMELDDALAWSEGKSPKEILELSISLEAGSYDRYLAMQERVSYENTLRLFRTLAAEEKRHLGRLTGMFERVMND